MTTDWGVIFDMDGTLLDNNPHHLQAWQAMCRRYGRALTEEEYREKLSGKTSADTLKYLFGDQLSKEELRAFRREKEKLYHALLAPGIEPLPGLVTLLDELRAREVPTAIASSGSPANIDLGLEHLGIRPYFKVVVNSSMIQHGKPDPEIYLLTAEKIGIAPERCVAFEDSLTGIASAKAAGMQVIALTTTLSAAELPPAHKIIPDYTAITTADLEQMIS